jgi:hypothetical protein
MIWSRREVGPASPTGRKGGVKTARQTPGSLGAKQPLWAGVQQHRGEPVTEPERAFMLGSVRAVAPRRPRTGSHRHHSYSIAIRPPLGCGDVMRHTSQTVSLPQRPPRLKSLSHHSASAQARGAGDPLPLLPGAAACTCAAAGSPHHSTVARWELKAAVDATMQAASGATHRATSAVGAVPGLCRRRQVSSAPHERREQRPAASRHPLKTFWEGQPRLWRRQHTPQRLTNERSAGAVDCGMTAPRL